MGLGVVFFRRWCGFFRRFAQILRDLRKNLRFAFSVTPEYFANDLQSSFGSGFSIHPDLMQSAYFRFHNKSEEAENLYLVGAGTHPGAGVRGGDAPDRQGAAARAPDHALQRHADQEGAHLIFFSLPDAGHLPRHHGSTPMTVAPHQVCSANLSRSTTGLQLFAPFWHECYA